MEVVSSWQIAPVNPTISGIYQRRTIHDIRNGIETPPLFAYYDADSGVWYACSDTHLKAVVNHEESIISRGSEAIPLAWRGLIDA